ncbi:MAG TPA: PCRF domain-containing protein, partial [Lacipirellulaceae bacterium]
MKKSRIAAIDAEQAKSDFWNSQERVQSLMEERKSLATIVTPLENALKESDDLAVAIELASEDESIAAEVPERVARLESVVEQLKLKALLNGPHDAAGAILSINARDGGTDANDWAEMLLRMYTLWAQKSGYSVELLERQDSEQAGISHAAIAVRGPMAYGYLKGETGMHRLVRISPFNAEGKRQTSFAAVDVSPEVSDAVEIEINPDDV